MVSQTKPLGRKSYGSICHLPSSRLGPGDHKITEGQTRILTEKKRDRHDLIIVQEKLDGSNVCVARVNGELLPLGRSGYLAQSSRFEQHHLFASWVRANEARFDFLKDGERLCGEWLAQAHGTRYSLMHEPFVVFDLMAGVERLIYEEMIERILPREFVVPHCLSNGLPCSVDDAMATLEDHGCHGALDMAEGAVWRCERLGKVDFLAKYVRHEKKDGCFLPEISGKEAVWNWRPSPRGMTGE